MAAAVLHAQQLGGALVELVVSDRPEVGVHQVRRDLDRLVVEQRARERAGPDVVAGEDGRLVRAVLGLFVLHGLRQVRRATGELAVEVLAARIERPVQVVERQDVHVRRLVPRRHRREIHGDLVGQRARARDDRPGRRLVRRGEWRSEHHTDRNRG
jgi:hypothetical protein